VAFRTEKKTEVMRKNAARYHFWLLALAGLLIHDAALAATVCWKVPALQCHNADLKWADLRDASTSGTALR